MTARADMSTKDGHVRCRLTTEWETVVFEMRPLAMMEISNQLHAFAGRTMLEQAAEEVAAIREELADLPPPPETGAYRQ